MEILMMRIMDQPQHGIVLRDWILSRFTGYRTICGESSIVNKHKATVIKWQRGNN